MLVFVFYVCENSCFSGEKSHSGSHMGKKDILVKRN